MASPKRLIYLVAWMVLLPLLQVDSRKPHQHGKSKKPLCPFPCVCHNDQVFCDGADMFELPISLSDNTTVLNAKNNHIKQILRPQLKRLPNLHTLSLRNNDISWIEPKAFQPLKKLKSLTVRDNQLEELDLHVFRSLMALEQLSLRNNLLTTVEFIFKGLKNLRLLSLGDNKITNLTHRTFRTNVRLYVIDMHNNSLTSIHRNSFRTLPFLRYLILRDNPLKSLALDFKFNYHLELMDLTNCQLNAMAKGLPMSIRDLRISENNITSIHEKDFKTTRKIRMLLLSQNNITKLHKNTFNRLHILYELYLNNNSLTQLPQHIPSTVRGLYMTNNSVTEVNDHDLENQDKLEVLHLSNNNIVNISKNAFFNQNRLKDLDISNNNIERLEPKVFENARKLELLDISHNPIDSADHHCFDGLQNLHILQMGSLGESKHVRPSIFESTRNLLFLDLSNSSQLARNFAESPFLLDYIASVEDLNLMHDGIYTLPADFPNHFPFLKTIRLVENPWHCDQSIFWLTRWMQNSSISFSHEDHMLCDSPPELRGRMISSLTLKEIPTEAPPRTDIKPDVEVIDIHFTLGKNYTMILGDRENFNQSQLQAAENSSSAVLQQGPVLQGNNTTVQLKYNENDKTVNNITQSAYKIPTELLEKDVKKTRRYDKEHINALTKQRLAKLLHRQNARHNKGKSNKISK